MEKLKKEFEQLFTKNATEITACPRIKLYGNPQELWLWILNNFTPKVSRVELPVKPANGGQIYLLYKRLLGYSDMTPVLVAVFDDVEKALDQKYKLQKDDHVNSYFIEDSRLSV